jgi:prevent-host-death family protein
MPTIISGSELRNKYSEISSWCHQHQEPIFITKNGQGDLAIMSIELYEHLSGKLELYSLLAEGRTAINEGRKQPLDEAMAELRRRNNRRQNG